MNTISASELIGSAWGTFKKRPWIFIGAIAVVVIVSVLIETIAGTFGKEGAGAFVGLLVSMVLSTFVGLGYTAFFLRAESAPEAAKLEDLWNPKQFWQYLGTEILVGVVVMVGIILLIIPGIIFAVMFLFAQYLVVDRGLGPIQAMKESMRITKGERWELFLFLLVCLILNILGALLLLVGLLVTVPVTMLAIVHAYRLLSHRVPESAAAPLPTPAA